MKETHTREMVEFNRIYKETDSIYTRYAASQNVSPTMLYILYSIYTEEKPCTQSQLTDDWGIPMQTVNSCLKTMERKGMIRMEFAEGNRKSKFIYFTEEGERMALEVVSPMVQAENRALDGLDADERRLLLSLTRKHSSLLQKYLLGQN